MNRPLARFLGGITCLAFAVLFGGCESVEMPSFSLPNTDAVQRRTLKRDADEVYAASRAALEAMDYTFVRGSRASGKLEMASRVLPGSALRARQRDVKITVVELDSGDAEVRVAIWETTEDESAAGTVTPTNRLVHDTSPYDVFWSRLDDQLRKSPPATSGGKS